MQADRWFEAIQTGDEAPEVPTGLHHFTHTTSQCFRCPYFGKAYPEDKSLNHYLQILTREGFAYTVKECDTMGPTSLKIYIYNTTQVAMFQSSNRQTLPVFVNRAVDVPRPNLNPIFPPVMLHRRWPKLVKYDCHEVRSYCQKEYMGRQRTTYLKALDDLERGQEKWMEGAINKLDETLYIRSIVRDDFLDNDPTQGTSWKIRQRIVQSSHPKVSSQINIEIDKITKRLIKDWAEPFLVNGIRVKLVYASKMTQHQLTKLFFELLERIGIDFEFLSLCAGDDSLAAYIYNGVIYFLEGDCSHMDASQWRQAMEHNYAYYDQLGMSDYALQLLYAQDSGPRLYTLNGYVVIVLPPNGQPIKNTGSGATSLGNTINAQAIIVRTLQIWNGDPSILKVTYEAAATQLNFVVKAFCAPWEERVPTFLKNLFTSEGFVLEPGICVKMGKILSDPCIITKTKDYKLAWRKMVYALSRCYRFYKVDLVVDAILRYYERTGIECDVKVNLEHYLLRDAIPGQKGGVYQKYDIYERYGLTRDDIDDCIRLIDRANNPFVMFSHPVFDRLGAIAYG